MEGDTLAANCRRADGGQERTALNDVRRCVGDIGNNNGNLQCAYGAGPARVQTQPPEYRREEADRCDGIRREAREVHNRIAATFDPIERARLETRMRELQGEEGRCG